MGTSNNISVAERKAARLLRREERKNNRPDATTKAAKISKPKSSTANKVVAPNKRKEQARLNREKTRAARKRATSKTKSKNKSSGNGAFSRTLAYMFWLSPIVISGISALAIVIFLLIKHDVFIKLTWTANTLNELFPISIKFSFIIIVIALSLLVVTLSLLFALLLSSLSTLPNISIKLLLLPIFTLSSTLFIWHINLNLDMSENIYWIYSKLLIYFWQIIGITSVILIYGLQNIEPAVIKSAKLDGASSLLIFTKIKLPLLKKHLLLVAAISVISAISVLSVAIFLPYFVLMFLLGYFVINGTKHD